MEIGFSEKELENGDLEVMAGIRYEARVTVRKIDREKYGEHFTKMIKAHLTNAIVNKRVNDVLSDIEQNHTMPIFYMGNRLIVTPMMTDTENWVLVHPKVYANILQSDSALFSTFPNYKERK